MIANQYQIAVYKLPGCIKESATETTMSDKIETPSSR